MKIALLESVKAGPWGGANQFLKALDKQFMQMGCAAESIDEADIVLFNSFPFGHEREIFSELHRLKNAGKTLVHRVDGPISLYRGRDQYVDKIIYRMNTFFADGTVFQSQWSKQKNYELGFTNDSSVTTISNAPDPQIFYPKTSVVSLKNKKIRLIATSWSKNMNKGFDVYRFLDENLDFEKYEMTFVGNSPISFKNILHIGPFDSNELADTLRKHDIYITASQKDTCSNSLIEAMHCGLPAVVLNDGGHPEIVGDGGAVFLGTQDVIDVIEQVVHGYETYRSNIQLPTLSEIAQQYYDFCVETAKKSHNRKRARFEVSRLLLELQLRKIFNKFGR